MLFHRRAGRVGGQSGVDQRRGDVAVAQGALDRVEVDTSLRHPGADRSAQVVERHVIEAGSLSGAPPGLVDVDEMLPLLLSWQDVRIIWQLGGSPKDGDGWGAQSDPLLFT